MLYIHPIWQVAFTLAAAYALFLGLVRLRSLHLGNKTSFKRKRHVFWGKLALVGWLLGLAGGVAMARYTWQAYFITGPHAYVGLVMLPLLCFGILSGLVLEKKPAPRRTLPLLHGLNNLLLVFLALYQFYLGKRVLEEFVSLY